MLHRRRPITEIDSNNPSRKSLAERMAINSVVQGSAADLIKLAMVNLQRTLDEGSQASLAGTTMLLQIHDELVFETPDALVADAMPVITQQMEAAMSLKVPLVADAASGKSWFESK
jgi:DNA polymerase-1